MEGSLQENTAPWNMIRTAQGSSITLDYPPYGQPTNHYFVATTSKTNDYFVIILLCCCVFLLGYGYS